MGLLHIYDSSDKEIAENATKRAAECKLPIAKVDQLDEELNKLFHERNVFDRILFETHGDSGKIKFNHQPINVQYWKLKVRRYEFLTASYTKIYFNGCNVAEGEAGWKFLEAVAGAFLSINSGEVFAYTSLGFTYPFGSHVAHLWGDLRTVNVKDGKITGRTEK
jgi:hypothetical protein